jgi:hypothetical protein
LFQHRVKKIVDVTRMRFAALTAMKPGSAQATLVAAGTAVKAKHPNL